jgi:hypothetical protein
VALVRTRARSGAGFLVRPGILVTSARTISLDLSENITVSFPCSPSGATPTGVKVLFVDRKRDVAVLKVPTDLPPLHLAKECRGGDNVVLLSYAARNHGEARSTIITQVRVDASEALLRGRSWIKYMTSDKLAIPVGPMFNYRGEVVAISCFGIPERSQEFAAVGCGDIVRALEQGEVMVSRDPEQATAEHDFMTTFAWVGRAVYFDRETMFLKAKVFEVAAKDRVDPKEILRINPKVVKELEEMAEERTQWNGLGQTSIDRVVTSRVFKEETRSKLRELWELHKEMSDWISKETGAADGTFGAKAKEFQDKFKRLTDEICNDVGVEFPLAMQG